MATFAAVALGATFAASAGAQASARPSTTERTLFRLEDEFATAVVRRDAASLRRLVAPRWVYSDESGVMTRDAGVAAFTSGADTVTTASNADMHAYVYGNAAVVTGVLRMAGRGPVGAFDRRYRYTDTWAVVGGRWQCVASQDYLMPTSP